MLSITEVLKHDKWVRSEKKEGKKLECDEQKISNRKVRNLDLSMSIMTETHFSDTELTQIDFSYSNLSASVFNQSTLTEIKNVKSIWEYVEYEDSKIIDCDFFRSNVYENKFVNVSIKNTNFQKTLFSNSVFENVIFNNVDFSNASLDSCQFIDCKFKEVIGIESINANGLILKDSLSNNCLSDAESIRKYINDFLRDENE